MPSDKGLQNILDNDTGLSVKSIISTEDLQK